MQGGRNSPSRVAAHCTWGKASAPNWRWAQPTYLAREAAKSKLPRCSVRRAAFPLNSLKWQALPSFSKLSMCWQNAVLGRGSLSRIKTSWGCVPYFAFSKGGATPILLKIWRWLRGRKGGVFVLGRGDLFIFFRENTFWPRKNEQNDNLSWSS